jgi:hypothetical protein
MHRIVIGLNKVAIVLEEPTGTKIATGKKLEAPRNVQIDILTIMVIVNCGYLQDKYLIYQS